MMVDIRLNVENIQAVGEKRAQREVEPVGPGLEHDYMHGGREPSCTANSCPEVAIAPPAVVWHGSW